MQEEQVKSKKQIEAENNAKLARNVAEIASKTSNPYAKGIGTAVKTADKLTNGKATEAIGKAMRVANKMPTPGVPMGGKSMQKAANFLGNSGLGDKLTSLMQKKNNQMPKANKSPQPQKTNGNINAGSSKINNGLLDFNKKKKMEEESPDNGGFSSFKISYKAIQIALITCIPVFTIIMFCCVIISSTQVYLNSIGFGMADRLKGQDVEDKINNATDEEINQEITDERIEEETDNKSDKEDEETAFATDIYISDTPLKNSKLNNYIQVNNVTYFERKYNEAKLEDLEEFYPPISNASQNYSKNDVYDFYNKMYDIYVLYRDTYKVYLDLPLLMSTLKYQSTNMNTIFSSNLSDEDKTDYNVADREEFDYYYDWTQTDYKLDNKNSEHDMEILAQNMVSMQQKEKCINSEGKVVEENILRDSEIGTKTLSCEEGETYETESLGYVVDNEKYKDFLKEFIEKKYYYSGQYKVERKNEKVPGITSGSSTCSVERQFIKYELTQDQLEKIASLCYYEQGTAEGAAAEASLIANLFEIKGSSYGSGANGLYNYVRTSGWFASASSHMDAKSASDEIIAAVKSVLVDGKRTLPGYIDEHDCISCSRGGAGDITSVTNNGVAISKNDKSSYIAHTSVIKTVYGATYTFYSFPTDTSDPFGYTSEERKNEMGDFHYDYKTGEPVGCSSTSSDMAEEMVRVAMAEYNEQETNYFSGMERYGNAFGWQGAWCAQFVWYVSSKTEYNGQKLYPDIVKFKSASTGDYMKYFYTSQDPNIKFYYNDSCSVHSGKNGSTKYIPKPGDYMFFDWGGNSFNIENVCGSCGTPQDHTAMVQKVENGKVIAIEGNAGSPAKIRVRSYDLNSCVIMGYGSWY